MCYRIYNGMGEVTLPKVTNCLTFLFVEQHFPTLDRSYTALLIYRIDVVLEDFRI